MNLLIPENSYLGKCSCGAEYLAPKGTLHCTKCLYSKITELEKGREQHQTVEKWVQCFTMSDLEVHNLEQQISALTFALENITKPEDIYCRRKELRKQAAKLKGGE